MPPVLRTRHASPAAHLHQRISWLGTDYIWSRNGFGRPAQTTRASDPALRRSPLSCHALQRCASVLSCVLFIINSIRQTGATTFQTPMVYYTSTLFKRARREDRVEVARQARREEWAAVCYVPEHCNTSVYVCMRGLMFTVTGRSGLFCLLCTPVLRISNGT